MVYYSTLVKKLANVGRIYRYMVYLTLVWSNIPEYGILFDFGKKELVKVEYTVIWYIQPW